MKAVGTDLTSRISRREMYNDLRRPGSGWGSIRSTVKPINVKSIGFEKRNAVLRVFVLAFIILIVLVISFTPSARAADSPTQAVIQQIVEQVKPTLVRIHVVENVPEQGRESKSESYGTYD